MKKNTKNTRYLQIFSLITGCVLTVILTRVIEKAFPEPCNHPESITRTDTLSIRIEYPERRERYRRMRNDSISYKLHKNEVPAPAYTALPAIIFRNKKTLPKAKLQFN